MNFRAREVFDFDFKEWCGKKTRDIYSYGLVIWQIAKNGKIPFEGMKIDEIDIAKCAGQDLVILLGELPEDTPAEIQKVITGTAKHVPSERVTLDDIKCILEESGLGIEFYRFVQTATLVFMSGNMNLII